MVTTFHDQRRAQRLPQTYDPLPLGHGRSRALGIRPRDLFTRPRRHRTGPFVWPRSLPERQQEHPMPPQETNVTSESGSDAARLCVDVPIAAWPGAIAAPRDAVSEKEAAGPPIASTRNVLSLLKRCWRAFLESRQRARLRASLHDLSERELKDIGLTPGDIDYMVAHRTIEKLRDGRANLWISRGLM